MGYPTDHHPTFIQFDTILACNGQTHKIAVANAVVTCEIKLFQKYFSLRRCSNWNNFA